ncbi:GAF domain-containing protein [Sphingomonas flavalba]|uniref:GAF domain-containing protein n=1 Tax=Sphingomonas flavalba TaxID=2559804 RepID=UPI0039E060A4
MSAMSEPTVLARWSATTDLIRRLAGAFTIDDTVAILRDSARRVAASDGITVVRREGAHVRYVAEDAVAPLWTGQSFPIKACISGLAMLDRAPIIIPDISKDPRLVYNYYRDTFVRSMAMFPVGVSTPGWAIGAYWAKAQPIDPDTIDLLATLARAVGATLEKIDTLAVTRQHEERLRAEAGG